MMVRSVRWKMKLCPACGNLFPDDVTACLIDGTPLAEPTDPLLGKLVGGCYRISHQIASGGMGNVYSARHEYLNREVAVKILKPLLGMDEEYRQRVIREARICATVDHVHIVKAFDLIMAEGLVCLVMEMLKGETLKARLGRVGTLDVTSVLRMMSMTAEALASAHSLDIVHRDIKPSNIFLARYMGADDFVKLLDFGIAFAIREGRLTRQGAVVGTPPYMSPELFRGREPTKASDVYSLACVCYQALTGRSPFHSSELAEIVTGHLERVPLPVREARPDVPEALEAILERMLLKDPEKRYQDAFALLNALKSSGLYNQEYEERPSLTGAEEATEEITLRSEWGQYFDAVSAGQPEDGPHLESVRAGLMAVNELVCVEDRKREVVRKLEQIEGKRRSTQRNIANALRTLHSDLSRLREDHELEHMEYLTAGSRREFLAQEVLRMEVDLFSHLSERMCEEPRELTTQALQALVQAGDTARSYLASAERTGEIKARRAAYPKTVRDTKFQIERLQGRIKEVEQESAEEYERLRATLDALSAEGERLRAEVALAASEIAGQTT